MWRHCLLLALHGFAVFADADIDVTETGPNEELAEEDVEIESAVISLYSKDFSQVLQDHPLLMVRHMIVSHLPILQLSPIKISPIQTNKLQQVSSG